MRITAKEVLKYFKKRNNWWKAAVIVIAILGIVYFGIFLLSFGKVCADDACFYEQMVKCKKTTFVKDTDETIKQYTILGKNRMACNIKVELLLIKQGSTEMEDLEGKSMICSMPLGTFEDPEDNLRVCHGTLREDIQEIIIQRMHSQIVENIGQINEELTQVKF